MKTCTKQRLPAPSTEERHLFSKGYRIYYANNCALKIHSIKRIKNCGEFLILSSTPYIYMSCMSQDIQFMWTRAEYSKGEKLATFSTNKLERFRNVASDLALAWKTVTKLNVGNKQQVTQMYTSHATQLVIHLTVWLKPYSLWLCFLLPSFLITAENRQTHEWGWMQVINIMLTNYTMLWESK